MHNDRKTLTVYTKGMTHVTISSNFVTQKVY